MSSAAAVQAAVCMKIGMKLQDLACRISQDLSHRFFMRILQKNCLIQPVGAWAQRATKVIDFYQNNGVAVKNLMQVAWGIQFFHAWLA